MNGVQTRFKCKLDVKRCKRFVFPPSSLLPRSNALKTKAIRYFQTDRTLTRIVSPPLEAPHSVALASNKYSVKAGSDEVIRIEIDITDKNGIPCPYASNELSFHVSGPLRLLGVDNGNPTDMFPYQQPHCRCFRGKCVVLLQSDEEKGKGTLTVQGTKLVEKKLIIEVI